MSNNAEGGKTKPTSDRQPIRPLPTHSEGTVTPIDTISRSASFSTPYTLTPSGSSTNLIRSGASTPKLRYDGNAMNKHTNKNPFSDIYSISNDTTTQKPRPAYSRVGSRTFSLQSSVDGSETPSVLFSQENISTVFSEKTRFRQSCTSFQIQYDPKDYSIETIHKHDDQEFLPPFKRLLYRFSPLFTLLAVAAYFTYYAYRIICTIDSQKAYSKTYVMAWLFISAEGCVACKCCFACI